MVRSTWIAVPPTGQLRRFVRAALLPSQAACFYFVNRGTLNRFLYPAPAPLVSFVNRGRFLIRFLCPAPLLFLS